MIKKHDDDDDNDDNDDDDYDHNDDKARIGLGWAKLG